MSVLGHIIDISHHQVPSKINYDTLAKHVDLAIIRTQYGSKLIDRHYKTHHKELKKRGVPTAAYAWVRGVSINDMRVEARDFYNRTKEFNPTIWYLDVEEKSMGNMRAGINAYIEQLRSLGAKKVGLYIGHHLYKEFNLDVSKADTIWIPRYSTSKPNYPCDLWQYTSSGKIPGYSGNLDISRLNGTKKLSFYTEQPKTASKKQPPDKADPSHQSAWVKAYNAGALDGTNPGKPVTREQLATVLVNTGVVK